MLTFVTELVLPLFDFISDILNGRRLIKDCHPILGSLTIGVVFAPMALFVPLLALAYSVVQDYFDSWSLVLDLWGFEEHV